MNDAEFRELRARTAVPHDDEIHWDAHDRIPDGGNDYDNMPPRFGWMLIPVFIVIGIVIAYLLQ